MKLLVRTCAFVLAVVAGCGDDGHKQPIDAAPMPDAPAPDPAMLGIDRTLHQFGSVTVGWISPPATLTITNTGDLATGSLAPSLTGADAASFVLVGTGCVTRLQPGASCVVTVMFSPATPGAKTATVVVGGTPGGSISASLEGAGVAVGALTVSASLSALGNVVIGQTSTLASTFTVTNSGGTPSGPLAIQPAGSDPAEFTRSADQCTGVALPGGASCTFVVRFTPTSAGAKAALFQISASPGGVVSGSVTGTSLPPASIVVVPLQLDFGSVVVGQSSASLTAIVTNTGGVPTGVLAPSVTGADAAMFTALGCTGATLAAGTSCTVTVTFNPTSTGAHSAMLSVTATPGGAAATTLGGIGIAAGQLVIAPSAHAFANTNVGQTSAARQFTITNTAAAATGPLSTTLGGSQTAQFRVIAGSDGCTGIALAPGANCTISLAFQPTVGGIAHASLTVAGAPGGSVTAGLSGLGVSAASLSITPATRDFGSVTIGAQSMPLRFTVTNTGGQVTGVPAATLAGAGAGQFMIAGSTCAQTLAPGASCALQIRFAPTAVAGATAALGVVASPGGSVSATVSGTGMADGGLVIIPSSYEVPATTVGDPTAPQTLTVLNTGEATTGPIALTVTGTNANEFAIASTTCTVLASNETCTVTVVFTPLAIGTRAATLTASATPGGIATAALSGISRPRVEIIAINSGPVVDPYNFGAATISNVIPQDVLITVRNNTSAAKVFSTTEAFGSPAQYAAISNTCSTTIGGAGGTCTIGVRFTPTSVGPKSGTFTFSIGAGTFDSAAERLAGTGVEGLTLTPLNGTSFGSVPLNTTSGTLRFRLTNAPGSVLTGPIVVTLSGGPFQLVADPCSGTALASGASCLLDVRFAPTGTGPASATLAAIATPGGAPALALAATGVSPVGNAPTDIVLAPNTIAENSPNGSTVGTLTTVDADLGDTFVYALVPGAGSTDNGAFTLSGAVVSTVGVFDFETKSVYTIRVRTTDGGGQVFEKALTINVRDLDEAPVAVDDTATVVEDSGANAIDVLANDTDVDGGPKRVQTVTQPAHGSVVITGGGTGVAYTPAPDSNGPDGFTYTLDGGSLASVSIAVAPVDDLPVAVADAIAIPEDTGTTPIAVLVNDTDVDGGPMQIIAVTPVAHGTLEVTGGGTGVTYTPDANTHGTDAFTYTLNGGAMATVTITVLPVDDPPVAIADAAATLEDAGPAFVDVLANDTDIDGGPMTVVSFTQPAHGTVAAFQNGVTYQPAANFNGSDTFTYTLDGASTATVSFTVIPVDDSPTATNDTVTVIQDSGANALAVLANDLDIDAGPISIASVTQGANGAVAIESGNGSVAYTPNAGYCNLPGTVPDTFTYTLAPGGSTATVTVRVACLPTFLPATETSVGVDPAALVIADFNADGNLDVATANTTTNDVSVLLGLGTGGFLAAVIYPVGTNPSSLAAGDFSGDGVPDLAVANTSSGDVSILTNSGTGTFGAAASVAVQLAPSSIAVGDFDTDGRLDLAVTNASSDTLSIVLATGNSSFGVPTHLPTGAAPRSVAVADLDNDGRLDVVVANASSSTLTVRRGLGTGAFAAPTTLAVGSAPLDVKVGDVNGDGRRDLVVANSAASSVSVLLGTGGGGFAPHTTFATGAGPLALVLADWNRDGNLDVATANANDQTVTVLTGTGSGAFGSPVTLVVGPQPTGLAAGDLDNDSRTDLVLAANGSDAVSVFLGN